MENMYFKGLEKLLNEGCDIKVFVCSTLEFVVRAEKKDADTQKEILVAYSENSNVLSALNSASNDIINETSNISNEWILCENTLIDKAVGQGYTLHFFKLSNGQVLSTICCGEAENTIPIKSIISDDIESGFEILNASLKPFDFDESYDFYDFAESQVAPIKGYKKELKNQKAK